MTTTDATCPSCFTTIEDVDDLDADNCGYCDHCDRWHPMDDWTQVNAVYEDDLPSPNSGWVPSPGLEYAIRRRSRDCRQCPGCDELSPYDDIAEEGKVQCPHCDHWHDADEFTRQGANRVMTAARAGATRAKAWWEE